MNLTTYRKEFSIFIYNENIHLARLLKETLASRGYESHFYDGANLLKQAIFLALPHIVVLGYEAGIDAKIQEICKISKEIQIFVVGEAADEEAMCWLAEQGLIYDYQSEPVKHAQGFAHRIDKAVEKWLISFVKEQEEVTEIPQDKAPAFAGSSANLAFVESPQASVPNRQSEESLIYELLSQTSEKDAIAWVLNQLSAFSHKDFAFLKYSESSEGLVLKDISFGMSQKHEGLGIKLDAVKDKEHFFKNPSAYKVWTDFFTGVFSAKITPFFVLRSSGTVLGTVVGLGELADETMRAAERILKTLGLILENQYQARLIFDHMEIETKTFCLRSRVFYDKLNGEISRARRLSLPVSVASFELRASDVSHLLAAQQIVGKVLKRFTRVTDFVGRISDRRFAVALPHADLENAAKKASTLLGIIRAAMEEKKGLNVTVSAGVNEFPENVTDFMSLLEGSEEAAEQAENFEVLVYRRDEDRSADTLEL